MSFILALDQGTTSSRAIIFTERGAMQAQAQQAFEQMYPQPGWVEHDPMQIWQTQLACTRRALRDAHLEGQDISALAIANQRETTLIWDRATGVPIHNALVWQDRRTAAWCQRHGDRGHLDQVRAITGLVLDPYFSASKIAWLLDNVADARARAIRGELAFGTIDSWLIWNLTGGQHLTDTTNASRTLLFDIHRHEWSQPLLDLFEIPRALLPEVRPSSGDFGRTQTKWFGVEIPIASVVGDQQAALFGQGCFGPGQVKNTYGTGCFMLMHTGANAVQSAHGLLTTAAAEVAGATGYALEGSVFSAGSAVQWLRDELKIIEQAADIEVLARSVIDTGGVYLVPAFSGLGSPYWDANARGAILGITRGTNRAHIALAALEAIALQSAELLAAMSADAGLAFSELRVDGGASVNELLMQMQADLLGVPVVRPRIQETTALGAADLAGLAIGWWPSPEALSKERLAVSVDRVFEPARSRDWADQKRTQWKRAVERSFAWATSADAG